MSVVAPIEFDLKEMLENIDNVELEIKSTPDATEAISQLRGEIASLKSDIEQLKIQNQLLLKKTEPSSANTFKSFTDVKKELKAFFSSYGHSAILGTKNPFKKVFWLTFMLVLLIFGMILVDRNVKEYQMNSVITQIQVIDDETSTFPAITFCLREYSQSDDRSYISLDLKQVFRKCQFEVPQNNCNFDDFEYVPIYDPAYGEHANCYKFNGGKNASMHERELYSSSFIGYDSGLYFWFNLSKSHSIFYYVGANRVQPEITELNSIADSNKGERGNNVYVGIKKTVDIKLPQPFTRCQINIDSNSSVLVKQIFANNVTYRQTNCYNLCYRDFLESNARSRNKTYREIYDELSFDYSGSCAHKCPLECQSVYYELHKSERRRSASGELFMNFYLLDRKLIEISQAEKTTLADFVSNTGGVLGLFFEVTFISVHRLVLCICDFIVVFYVKRLR